MQNNKFILGFVFLIPIINAIATNTTSYFTAGTLNPGTVRAFLIGAFALLFIFNNYPSNSINKFVFGYLLFYLFLSLMSSKLSYTLYIYLKFFIAIIMFPIGYYFINDLDKFKKLCISLLIALIIFIINVILSNVFKLGMSNYLEDSFYFGAGRVNITKTMLILIFTAPVVLLLFRNDKRIFVISSISFLIGLGICFIGIKRSVLLSIPVGFIIYAYLKKQKTLLIKSTLTFGFILLSIIFLFPSYIDLFLERLEAREERIELSEETLETEGRYNEMTYVYEAWVGGSIKHKLIGSELFNDQFFFKTRRMLHTDYMVILNGSGAIGFFLWFYLFWRIHKEKNKYFKYLRNIYFFQELNAVFYMILSAQLLMSFSGTVHSIDLRSYIFLFWGATLGVMRSSAIKISSET